MRSANLNIKVLLHSSYLREIIGITRTPPSKENMLGFRGRSYLAGEEMQSRHPMRRAVGCYATFL